MKISSSNASSKVAKEDLFARVNEICMTVNKVISAKDLLKNSLHMTMKLFGAKRGSIFILNSNGKDLSLRIAEGMKKSEKDNMVKHMGKGIVGKVAQMKQPLFVDDIAKDSRFKNYKGRKSYRSPSFICAPLLLKDKLIGVINIADKASGKKFTQNELQLLDFLTSQIALNYRRIQLYTKFKTIIKERKDLKVQLGQTDKEAKSLKKKVVINEKLATIGKLAGGIAHEFNNPLDGVMRYTNLCLDHVQDDEVVRGYLMEVKHGLKRMANIVKNLLACSREQQAGADMVNVKTALQHAIDAGQTQIEQKNVEITTRVEEGIPEIIDLGLERVLTNLLHNAVDAIDDKGSIDVNVYKDNGSIMIAVKDTGCGIDEKEIEKIFEPFFTTKDIDKGCGLGLTIVGEIIKSYNGRIDVESKVGKGTTFVIRLPVE